MEYVEMIKDPQLVLGFQELIIDSDPVVVKRTVKVFTSVYHHTLRLLSIGELDEDSLMNSWVTVKEVVDTLLAMVTRCDNEGILIYLLRFLEAAVMSHLMFDVSQYPIVFERGREVVKTGLKALKDHVTTPYVGGSAFIVGIRALISIACLRPDLWEPVTDLLKKQLASLPPTLFDHNVRSLNKTLHRNLFRLLKRAETPELKGKLVEMMVGVGVSRKAIMPWAPTAAECRKREFPPTDDSVERRILPKKKIRQTTEPNLDEEPYSPGSKSPPSPVDPRLVRSNQPQDPRKEPSRSQVPSTTCPVTINKNMLFLTSLIPGSKAANNKQTDEFSPEENILFSKLTFENICSLVLKNLESLPDEEPKDFVSSFEAAGKVTDDVEVTKRRIAKLISKYLQEDQVLTMLSENSKSQFNLSTSKALENGMEDAPKSAESSMTTSSESSSSSSTPSSTPPLMDVDLRQVYPRPTLPQRCSMGDVDMRISDPRIASRDPRIVKDPRIRKELIDPRTNYSEQRDPPVNPRISNKSPEAKQMLDPRLSKTFDNIKKTEPRKTRWDARPSPPLGNSKPLSESDSSHQRNAEGPQPSRVDPRINRPQGPQISQTHGLLAQPFQKAHQVHGLLPLPDRGTFVAESILQFPSVGANDPRIQQQQNFTAPRFHFGPVNPLNQFGHSLGALPVSPNSMPPPSQMFNAFGWQAALRNPPPPLLVAQTLASVQARMLPPAMINL